MRITIKGRVFQEKKSVLAFVKALEYIGLDAVASVGIDYSGYYDEYKNPVAEKYENNQEIPNSNYYIFQNEEKEYLYQNLLYYLFAYIPSTGKKQ